MLTDCSYNSAIFSVRAKNEYDIYILKYGLWQDYNMDVYDKLDPQDWTKFYDTTFVSYGDVYLETDSYERWNITRPIKIAGQRDNIQKVTRFGTALLDFEFAVKNSTEEVFVENVYVRSDADLRRVFAERVQSRSRLQLSLPFLAIVIACNAVKLCTMVCVMFMYKADYLVTMGDSAASFLEHPDPTTERMCIMSKGEIVEATQDNNKTTPKDQLDALVQQSRRTWTEQYRTYSSALDRDRQVGSTFM